MYADFELSPDQRDLRATIRAFVDEQITPLNATEREWREDPYERVPWDVIEAASELGLRTLTVPEEYGGRDAGAETVCMAAEELAAGEMGVAVILDQTWKITRRIAAGATGELRERFFETFVDDPRHLLAVTATEPANGSNVWAPYEAGQLQTTARKEGDEWVIDGEKRYISNGADASTYVVHAQTDPDGTLLDGTSTFLVPADTDGLAVTHVWEKLSQRLINNATVEFTEMRVPEANLLGEVNRGMGNIGRVLFESHLEAAATTLGTARAAYEHAVAHAESRQQYGRPVIEHQAVGHDLAAMAAELEAVRAFVRMAARAADTRPHEEVFELGSMAKWFAARTSVDVCRRAMETFGGGGIMLDNPAQKYFRDAVSFLHSDGTQTMHLEKVARQLRARRAAAA